MQQLLRLLALSTLTLSSRLSRLTATCSITDHGAVPGNRTADARRNAAALQSALAACSTVTVPRGVFKVAPVSLPSHSTLSLDAGAVLAGSDNWRDYLPAVHFMPPMGNSGTQPQMLQLTPLLSARFAVNVTITGANGTIDGTGWFAWPSANWSSPDCGLHNRCAGPTYFGGPGDPPMRPPHLLSFTHCARSVLENVTFQNPAYWGVQHFFSNDTVARGVTILAPRWTREIAGFMPFSVQRYAVSDAYVRVGDDAVAIMSGPDWKDPEGCLPATAPCAVANVSVPTAGVTFTRLFVTGRSVAIGSEDFGNVTDVVFDECTIGDDDGSAPWAFKIKMHSNVGCRVGDVLVRNTKLGRIRNNTWQDPGASGGTALLMALAYNDPPINASLPQPVLSNISFINVTATSCVHAGAFAGGLHSISGLHFENCAFRATDAAPWRLTNVDTASCTSANTTPAFPTGGPC
jgi:polygalacturonase